MSLPAPAVAARPRLRPDPGLRADLLVFFLNFNIFANNVSGVSVAQIEKALEDGMREFGRRLWGKHDTFMAAAEGVQWTSAPVAAIPAMMKGKGIIVELLKLNPNACITGKKLDSALLACQKRESISTSITFEPHDAERLSEKIRILCCKLRKMTEAKEPLGII